MSLLMVGTDFSTRSDRALRRAILLARQAGYELLIVGIVDEQTSTGSADAQRREASQTLDRMRQTIGEQDGVPCRFELGAGHPADELARIAGHEGAAIMVIGPHRRSMLRDAFGAATAERVVRQSPTPLICANGIPAGPYRRLLLPVDLEAASRRAVRALRRLDFGKQAEIALLHVYDAGAREMLGRAGVTADQRRDYLDDCYRAASDGLRAFAALEGLEHAAQFVIESCGPMAADIEEFAADDGSDLLVVSRSDEGALGRAILGSVTEDLIRSGKMDVLVIPEER